MSSENTQESSYLPSDDKSSLSSSTTTSSIDKSISINNELKNNLFNQILSNISLKCDKKGHSTHFSNNRDDDYEELESMGLITIDRDAVQWAATITPAGIAYLGHD